MLAIFLDIEASGLDPYKHRIFEIAFKIVDAFSGEEKYSYQSIVHQPQEVWDQRDLMSIEINGFSMEKLSQGKEERVVRKEIIEIFTMMHIQRGNGVFICQNPGFDRGFFSQLVDIYTQERLNWPYHWLDFASMFWALSIKKFHGGHSIELSELQLSKNSIAKSCGLPIETTPHTAMNGVKHLILCYDKIVGFMKN